MKKMIILLAMVAALLMSTACADNPYLYMTDEELNTAYQQITAELFRRSFGGTQMTPERAEITFRGMPWGTSAAVFYETMLADGVNGAVTAKTIYSWERTDLSKGEVRYAYMPDGCGFEYSAMPENLIAFGVPVSEIRAYFTYGYDANGLHRLPEQSSLYHVVYSFDGVEDRVATADMLYDSMCALYGPAERIVAVKQYDGFAGYIDHAIWEDGHGNAVMLMNARYLKPDGSPYTNYIWHLDLCYGKTNSVELMQAVNAAK